MVSFVPVELRSSQKISFIWSCGSGCFRHTMLELLGRVVSAPSIAASIFIFRFLADVKPMLLTGRYSAFLRYDGIIHSHLRCVHVTLPCIRAATSRKNKTAAMCVYVSPKPAMQLQWAQHTSPLSSNTIQQLRGVSLRR